MFKVVFSVETDTDSMPLVEREFEAFYDASKFVVATWPLDAMGQDDPVTEILPNWAPGRHIGEDWTCVWAAHVTYKSGDVTYMQILKSD